MAVTSPLRAVLIAHFQASYNRLVRQVGSNGLLLLVIALSLVTVTVVVPVLCGFTIGAFFLANEAFEVGGRPELGNVIGFLITVVAIGGGVIGGVSGGTKQLAWEQYRAYPLKPLTLFAAELLAGLGDAITLLQALTLAGICFAVGIAAPSMVPGLILLAIESVMVLLCVQLIVGSLAERLVSRMKVGAGLSLGLAWLIGQWLSGRAALSSTVVVSGVRGAVDRLLDLAGFLPASLTIQAAFTGAWAGLWSGVVMVLALLGAAFLLLWRERDDELAQGGSRAERLWSYRRPVFFIARLQLHTLLNSRMGKFAFLMPLLTMVIVRGPFAQLTGRGGWLVAGSFIYLSLAANGLGFNQFGLDGHGVKTLFLLPIGERAILEGKQLGFAVWQGLQAALLSVLLLLLEHPELDELLAGALLFACYFLAQGVVGQRTSVMLPRRMIGNRMTNSQVPLPVVLIALGTTVGCGLVFGGAFWCLAHFARPLLLPGMALMAGGALWASRPFLGLNAAFLARNRERVVDLVG